MQAASELVVQENDLKQSIVVSNDTPVQEPEVKSYLAVDYQNLTSYVKPSLLTDNKTEDAEKSASTVASSAGVKNEGQQSPSFAMKNSTTFYTNTRASGISSSAFDIYDLKKYFVPKESDQTFNEINQSSPAKTFESPKQSRMFAADFTSRASVLNNLTSVSPYSNTDFTSPNKEVVEKIPEKYERSPLIESIVREYSKENGYSSPYEPKTFHLTEMKKSSAPVNVLVDSDKAVDNISDTISRMDQMIAEIKARHTKINDTCVSTLQKSPQVNEVTHRAISSDKETISKETEVKAKVTNDVKDPNSFARLVVALIVMLFLGVLIGQIFFEDFLYSFEY